jgi:RHS repeat-associated protein
VYYNQDATNYRAAHTWYVRDASGNVMATYTSAGLMPKTSTRDTTSKVPLYLSELHMYGSSRLGIWSRNVNMDVLPTGGGTVRLLGTAGIDTFNRGNKFFELSNHLGNVLVTVSDRKIGQSPVNNLYTSFTADVVSATDYAPFGMQMVGRSFDAVGSTAYRYGFNGKENDNEVKGEGNQQDYGMRIYDPRLGKFLSVDPLHKNFPFFTTYQYAGNSPNANIDLDGLENYNYNLQQVKKSEGGTSLVITYAGRTENDWLDKVAEFLGKEDLHVLYFKGEQIGVFSSFQDLKLVCHGKTVNQLRELEKERGFNAVATIVALEVADQLNTPRSVRSSHIPAANLSTVETVDDIESVALVQRKSNITTSDPPKSSKEALKAQRAQQLKVNKNNSIASEAITEENLLKNLGENEILLRKPRIYIGDGKNTKDFSVPDFAIYNTKTGQIVKIPAAKSGDAGLTNQQSRLNDQGGQFKGTKRERRAKKGTVPPGMFEINRTPVKR